MNTNANPVYEDAVAEIYVYQNGKYLGWDCFNREYINIGSTGKAHLSLFDPDVDTIDIQCSFSGDRVCIKNLTPDQYLMVNDAFCTEAVVNPLDTVNIGSYTLKIKISNQNETDPIPEKIENKNIDLDITIEEPEFPLHQTGKTTGAAAEMNTLEIELDFDPDFDSDGGEVVSVNHEDIRIEAEASEELELNLAPLAKEFSDPKPPEPMNKDAVEPFDASNRKNVEPDGFSSSIDDFIMGENEEPEETVSEEMASEENFCEIDKFIDESVKPPPLDTKDTYIDIPIPDENPYNIIKEKAKTSVLNYVRSMFTKSNQKRYRLSCSR